MSTLEFPDEILDAILNHYFHIPTNVFFSNLNVSSPNFFTSAPNNPEYAVLLVSRSVHQLALPHFYNTVIVRSTKQAKSICRSLYANPSNFTHFTRRIRIENGHLRAPALKTLFAQVGSRLEDLCIRVRYAAADHDPHTLHTEGTPDVTPALRNVNPIRLGIIDYAEEIKEIHFMSPILDIYSLGSVFWSRLNTLYLPYRFYSKRSSDYRPQQPGNDFLMSCPGLQTIHLPSEFSMSSVATFTMTGAHDGTAQVVVHGPEVAADALRRLEKAEPSDREMAQNMDQVRMLAKRMLGKMVRWQDSKGVVGEGSDDWVACSCGKFPCV